MASATALSFVFVNYNIAVVNKGMKRTDQSHFDIQLFIKVHLKWKVSNPKKMNNSDNDPVEL